MVQNLVALSPTDLLAMRRVHVLAPNEWAVKPGTDFWLSAAGNGTLTAGTTWLITDGGWTATSMGAADGSGADFLTRYDRGTPGAYTTNAQNDLLESPSIFGSYLHAHAASVLVGMYRLPRYIIADIYAAFTTASADEATTNLGFFEDGGSIVTAADNYAAFNSDSTNFRFTSNGTRGTNANAVAVDNNYHWFRIVMDRNVGTTGTAYGYIDGTLISSIALTDDECPIGFGLGCGGATNRIDLAQAHIYYAWELDKDPQYF